MANKSTHIPSTRKIRAKKVLDKIVESNGKISMQKAMIESGYSVTHAHNSHLLTRSKMWQDLLNEFLPDELLLKKHFELLTKLDDKGEVDVQATARALDLAYKIKNRYQQSQTNVQINNFIPLLGGDSVKNVHKDDSNREDTETTKED
jgi:hypothetical protein